MQKFFDCGIDLGTTNSCIAVPDGDNGCTIIENQMDRMNVVPSAVQINAKGRMQIGQRAYDSKNSENLAIQFKRQMGTEKVFHFEAANIDKTPEELSAEILMRLKSNAEQRGQKIEDVVITVPAAFKTLQSEATNKAARLAGFRNVVLLQEPIAAAVAYGAKPDSKDKSWMVFDYGGGTLDVAIISTRDGRLEVLNSEGDNYFGGSDIDRLIYQNLILPKMKAEYAVDGVLDESTTQGKNAVRQILLACETCKIALSSSQETIFSTYDLGTFEDDDGNEVEFECTITRKEFESLIESTIDRAIAIAKNALAGSGLTANQIDKILLVGGSTFIPLVREKLTKEFKVDLGCTLNPMTVVAEGAAIYAMATVIDVGVETEATAGKISLNLSYEPIVSTEMVEVIGRINAVEDSGVAKLKIDRTEAEDNSGVSWTSGLFELDDPDGGVFFADVPLTKGKLNRFVICAYDAKGSEIEIDTPTFQIKHNENVLKMSAPPATASIGIVVHDEATGHDKMEFVIRKNAPLPAKKEKTFKIRKDLDPKRDDQIVIEIREGENEFNPCANFTAGCIYVKSIDVNQFVAKDTEIELTITIDEDRMITVEGYIPDIDYAIDPHQLRPEQKSDLSDMMEEVHDRIEATRAVIDRIESNGGDATEFEERIEALESEYYDVCRKVDSDDASVNAYINSFYELQTEVIDAEKATHQEDYTAFDERYQSAKENVDNWGNYSRKSKFAELESSYSKAKNKQEKEYIVSKMEREGTEAMLTNFNFLALFFKRIVPTMSFNNERQAEYWKGQADQAIDDEDSDKLREALIHILELSSGGSSATLASMGADLTI